MAAISWPIHWQDVVSAAHLIEPLLDLGGLGGVLSASEFDASSETKLVSSRNAIGLQSRQGSPAGLTLRRNRRLCTRAWSKEQVFQAGLCGCLETMPFVDRHQHGRFAAAAKRHRRSLNPSHRLFGSLLGP